MTPGSKHPTAEMVVHPLWNETGTAVPPDNLDAHVAMTANTQDSFLATATKS